jgi:hypothetical protein
MSRKASLSRAHGVGPEALLALEPTASPRPRVGVECVGGVQLVYPDAGEVIACVSLSCCCWCSWWPWAD